MQQWRYTRDADGEYHWVGSSRRPICPMNRSPIPIASRLPERPTITIRKASEALVFQALAHSGCQPRSALGRGAHRSGRHHHPSAADALDWQGAPGRRGAERPAGWADHQRAERQQVVLLTNMGKQVIAATIETAERERGVVAKSQEIDNPLLGVLDLASGAEPTTRAMRCSRSWTTGCQSWPARSWSCASRATT